MEKWVKKLGFLYNPFLHLEASTDRYLTEYIVSHRTFAIAWEERPSLVYALAGGGKTTMRIYTAQACWNSLGIHHPFPIPYYLPYHFTRPDFFTIKDHLPGILEAWAASMLIGLAFRPEHLLDAPRETHRRLARLLQLYLPGELSRYLEILDEAGVAYAMQPLLDPAYWLTDPPKPELLRAMCHSLLDQLPHSADEKTTEQDFEEFLELTLGELKFRSVFLLIDGIDGFPELRGNPQLAAESLIPLLSQAAPWSLQQIFIKGFLPLEIQPYLNTISQNNATTRLAYIQWDVANLSEMIQKRVEVASGGNFDSMDALCSPGLRSVETTLAEFCPPLPRELLRLVTRVIYQYMARTENHPGPIEEEDIQAAKQWYTSRTQKLAQFAVV